MIRGPIDWRPYAVVEPSDGLYPPAPILHVILATHARTLRAVGIVDSGSDVSSLPLALARQLGVELEGEPRYVDVMGAVVSVRSAYCDLRVATSFGLLTFRGVEFSVPESEEGSDLVVLGQVPLFEEIEVRFQAWARRFGLVKRGHGSSWTSPPVKPAGGRAFRAIVGGRGGRAPRSSLVQHGGTRAAA